jgi:YD repeat-containing protein
LRKLLRLSLAGGATVLALLFILIAFVFSGPVSSGAIFLLMPGETESARQDPSGPYEPRYNGHVDLSTGQYTREDDDLVVTGTPPLVLRRTYFSGWRSSREFGVNTTHSGETYLAGDPKRFQWASVFLADGDRIDFHRVSPGTGFMNSMFEHWAPRSYYDGARLGWTGLGWTMRRRDGSTDTFQSCGPGRQKLCSVVQTRDPEGRAVQHRRAPTGRLLRMEASADRWIAFDYDDRNRITRAYDATRREVRYAYDERGRLSRVDTVDGQSLEYTYTEADGMRTLAGPELRLENTYDADGRVIRQDTWSRGDDDPDTSRFEYRGGKDAIVETKETRSDGTWSKYTFDASRNVTGESWGEHGKESARVGYDRDSVSKLVVGMTLTCPDRSGRQTPHSSGVQPGSEDWVKWDLFQTHCTWSDWIKGRQARRLDREPQ